MDTMIGVSAALAILESSTDTELAPALLQRPALADRLRTLVGPAQGTASAPAQPQQLHVQASTPHSRQRRHRRHCRRPSLQCPPSVAAKSMCTPCPQVSAQAPPAQQLQQAPRRPDFWEEHWSQPRTAWADEVDDEWELKGAGKHSKGGKGRRMHYDDFNAQRAPHASQWEKGWALQGKGAQHWEKGAPQAPPGTAGPNAAEHAGARIANQVVSARQATVPQHPRQLGMRLGMHPHGVQARLPRMWFHSA